MSDSDREEQTPVQIDIYGVKIKTRPQRDHQDDPSSWADVGRRLNQDLMTIVAGVGRLLATTVKAATNIVRGVGDLGQLPTALEQRISKAHDMADTTEAQHAEDVAPLRTAAAEKIRRLLARKNAEGWLIAAQEEDGTVLISMLPQLEEDQVAAVADRALGEARRIEQGSLGGTRATFVVVTEDRAGVLAELISQISKLKLNIRQMETHTSDGKAVVELTLEIKDPQQLPKVLQGIQSVSGVLRVDKTRTQPSRT